MNRHDIALIVAGILGAAGAIVHGVLTQRHLVRPIEQLTATSLRPSIRRLIAGLLQFSAFVWFIGGVALVVAPWLDPQAKLATGLLVGSSYLYAAIGNGWAMRGRHPGWVIYAVALMLIVYGVFASLMRLISHG